MSYHRVLPRDLFNEAKLFKCLGRLFLMEADGQLPDNVRLIHNTNRSEGFIVSQDPSDGSLYVENISIFIDDIYWNHSCDYNSKRDYTLRIMGPDDSEFYVFDKNGKLMPSVLIRKEDD